jgi:hypothetical protein
MPNENLIHIKLERGEALESKRDVLGSQITLLRILKRANTYRVYRAREFELKLTLYKKIKELKTNLATLQRVLPQLKLPKVLKKETDFEGKKVLKTNIGIQDLSIEGQLQEIQRKLDDLQRRNS